MHFLRKSPQINLIRSLKDDSSLLEAMKSQEWPLVRESIQTEINALISLDVFDHLKSRDDSEVPSSKKIFKLLLLLKRMRDQHREISKYKARLVMDGSKAVIGKDLCQMFSPVVHYSTVRLHVSSAFASRWKIKQWDISVAFTIALAVEETYMANKLTTISNSWNHAGGYY